MPATAAGTPAWSCSSFPGRITGPGTGDVFISVGRGAEGFLTDARAGRIRDSMLPFLAAEDYGKGVGLAVDLIAQAFAQEFGVHPDRSLRPGWRTVREPPGVQIPSAGFSLWSSFSWS